MRDSIFSGRNKSFARRHPKGAAHKGKILNEDNGFNAADISDAN